MRVRGEGDLYDFESLRWLESVPLTIESNATKQNQNKDRETNLIPNQNSNQNLSVLGETKAEVKLGRSLAARLLKRYSLVRDLELTRYLNSIATKLGSVSSRKDLEFRVGVIESNEIYAFSCPGGYLFLTTGSLKKSKRKLNLQGSLPMRWVT